MAERLAEKYSALRPLPPIAFDPSAGRLARVPIDGYLKLGGAFYCAPERLVQQRVELHFDRDQVWMPVAKRPRISAVTSRACGLPSPIPQPQPPPPSVPVPPLRTTIT